MELKSCIGEESCPGKVVARQLCSKHWKRWQRGEPIIDGRPSPTTYIEPGDSYQCNKCLEVKDRDKFYPYAKTCKECIVKQNAEPRKVVLDHYGRVCACCGGEDDLQIDHVNGDGGTHRNRVGGGTAIYRYIIKNDFPEGFQTLCGSCNRSKTDGHRCRLHLPSDIQNALPVLRNLHEKHELLFSEAEALRAVIHDYETEIEFQSRNMDTSRSSRRGYRSRRALIANELKTSPERNNGDIARQFGCHKATVKNIRRELGIPAVGTGAISRGYPAGIKTKALDLWSGGMAYRDIARELDIPAGTVSGWIWG